MRKKLLRQLLVMALIPFLPACNGLSGYKEPSFSEIENGFKQIPDSVQTAVYWYWISNNISKDGVVKDLQAMKQVGINRAFLGSMGVDGVPYGDVKFFSPEWWDITHTALKTASDLGIEIGIFNSPGWSQSGGPWVKPEESMRYLASQKVNAAGNGAEQTFDFPDFGPDAQLVKILAYPTVAGENYVWNIKKEEGKVLTTDLPVKERNIIRSFSLKVNNPIKTTAVLSTKVGNVYKELRKFEIDRSNPALNVGFDPYAPVVIAVSEIDCTEYRLTLDAPGAGDMEVSLSEIPLVERFPEKTLAKMFQTPLPMWHEYMWKQQPEVSSQEMLVDAGTVLDLTEKADASGKLSWKVPNGEWTILFTAMRTTGVTNSPAVPEATGLEIDKMSKTHVQSHFDSYIGEILKRIPAEDRKTFKVVVQDSYETGGLNWTDDMIDCFKEKYGYDPVPYIPVLSGTVVGSKDISDRFLWDLRRLIADRVAYDYVGGLREICHKHGLQTWLENYGHWGFPGEFLMYGGQSDQISGEFWSEGSLGDIENRAASSCGHIYGKRQIWAESCTSGGPVFSRYPNVMKQRVDRFFTEGINSTLLHLYIQQPDDRQPGLDAWFGNEFNRNNTWFFQMDVFIEYLKRCNFMLQQGRYVADVAYFIGEDAPKMTGVCDPVLPRGYSFDYINAEILLNHALVKDGKLILDSGMEYRVLVLPKQRTMRPEVLRKVDEFVKDGLTVVGPAPKQSPSLANYPESDKEVRALAVKLWGNANEKVRSCGLGKIYSEKAFLEDVFKDMNIAPDFALDKASEKLPVLFIHRHLKEGEIYFVSNQSGEKINIKPSFRISGLQPELWNPLTGEVRLLPEFTEKEGSMEVPLELQALESAFIIFRNPIGNLIGDAPNYPQKNSLVTVETAWSVSFEKGKRGPESPVIMEKLYDLTTSSNDSIRFFSGEVSYNTTVAVDKVPEGETYLDLGKVMVLAKVKVNGKEAGGVWTSPYRVNISDCIREGENTIEITVVNNWMNRLIGDARIPEDQRQTWTNINPWNADSPLQSSGLLGPVEIYTLPYANK